MSHRVKAPIRWVLDILPAACVALLPQVPFPFAAVLSQETRFADARISLDCRLRQLPFDHDDKTVDGPGETVAGIRAS